MDFNPRFARNHGFRKVLSFIVGFFVCFLKANANDIFDLDLIYNESFQFSLPRKMLEGYFSGKAFDYPIEYSFEEASSLRDDIQHFYDDIMLDNPLKQKIAIMTAGAPGSGKTVLMRQDIAKNVLQNKKYAYIDPDDVFLKNYATAYQNEIEHGDRTLIARQHAYNKWRPGSNAAVQLILANLIRQNYAFYYGMTSTSPATFRFFEFLKAQGYQIRLLHISAPDNVRWESIKERDKAFVQTTEEDIREKGLLLPQRLYDTYLKYADEIEFYYRDAVDNDAVLAARWISPGSLTVINNDMFIKIKELHNKAVQAMDRPDLYW